MSYFAAALVRSGTRWAGTELDLDEIEEPEDVADLVREVDTDAELALLFVESDDEFLVITRLDGGDELRVFGSDVAFATESRVGAALLDGLEAAELPAENDDADDAPELMGQPVGDVDLLADLGVSGPDLVALCAHEGLLPADVMLEISRKVGCADALTELRD